MKHLEYQSKLAKTVESLNNSTNKRRKKKILPHPIWIAAILVGSLTAYAISSSKTAEEPRQAQLVRFDF